MLHPVQPLVRIKHGSHLYGTHTPESDRDYKGVHLPSGRGILLGQVEQHIDAGTKTSMGLKNEACDIDETSYALGRWIHMLADGDTFATEILFAPPSCILFQHDAWEGIRERAKGLNSKQCAGFLAYVQRQAAKYGIKGSRMAACRDIITLLRQAVASSPNGRLRDVEPELRAFVATHEHSIITPIPTQQGGMLDHLEIVDRKFPLTVRIIEALKVYQGVYDQYGSRARSALGNQNIDWKSLSHAVRVGAQAIELLETGSIQFPRPDADYLLAIKRGEIPFKVVSAHLEELVEEVERVSRISPLPDEPDRALGDAIVIEFHRRQVCAL